jgi:hypothetical protein
VAQQQGLLQIYEDFCLQDEATARSVRSPNRCENGCEERFETRDAAMRDTRSLSRSSS